VIVVLPNDLGTRARPIEVGDAGDVEDDGSEAGLFVSDVEDDDDVLEIPRRPRRAANGPGVPGGPHISDKVIVGKFTWVDRFDGYKTKHNLVKAWFKGPRRDAQSLTCQLQSENENFDRQNLPEWEVRRHCLVKGQGQGPRREISLESVHFKPYYQYPRHIGRAGRRAWLARRIQQQIRKPFHARV